MSTPNINPSVDVFGLGGLCRDDPAFYRYTPAAVVLEQAEIRHGQNEKELSCSGM
ncbi:hypothetical protein scyTo_0022360, partial [Scyliorhinus torazame]|nr:hypothetical protein [Scyliorhinus torazame]